jgi:site-specific recombinase XerD
MAMVPLACQAANYHVSVSSRQSPGTHPDKRHPKDMGAADIEAFLTHLAVQQKVAASTHNQALSALPFLSREVLRHPLDRPIEAIRARKPTRVPTVLTTAEALKVMGSIPASDA